MKLHLTILLSCLFICTAYTDYIYLGCYNVNNMRWDMISYSLSVEMCINFCSQKSSSYAFLHSGNRCLCAKKEPLNTDKRPEVDCNLNCRGENTRLCGGHSTSSVYKVSPVPLRLEYVGCYLDNGHRKLKGNHTISEQMTPRMCIDHCKTLGYVYAGLQHKKHCFCGNEIPEPVDRKSVNECNNTCSGDKHSKCGGSWRNSIYKTDPKEYEYLGCYVDDTTERKLRGMHKTHRRMSQQFCIDYCKSYNYIYAGLQFGFHCYCGDQTPLNSDRTTENQCSSHCFEDSFNKCGGDLRNSIFKTGAVPLWFQYVGCYLDNRNNRKLKGNRTIFPEDLTPRKCINYCKTLDYTYAGLQHGKHCFCGNEIPESVDKKSDDNCNIYCPGDFKSYCGGPWRNSIYEIKPTKRTTIANPVPTENKPTVPPAPSVVVNNTNGAANAAHVPVSKPAVSPVPSNFATKTNGTVNATNVPVSKPAATPGRSTVTNNTNGAANAAHVPVNKPAMSPGPSNFATNANGTVNATNVPVSKPAATPGRSTVMNNTNEIAIANPVPPVSKPTVSPGRSTVVNNTNGAANAAHVPVNKPAMSPGPSNFATNANGTVNATNVPVTKPAATPGRSTVMNNKQYKYLGCYDSVLVHRKLLEYHEFPQGLTQQMCITLCKEKNYAYAGLQAGYCLCGNEIPHDAYRKSEDECNFKCPGNPQSKCGGLARSAIFRIVPTNGAANAAHVPVSKPAMSPGPSNFATNRNAMVNTTNVPVSKPVATLGHSTVMNNTNEIAIANPVPPVSKPTVSPGRSTVVNNINGTAKVDDGPVSKPAAPPGLSTVVNNNKQYEYLGCYVDDGSRRKLQAKHIISTNLTQQMCIDYCKEYNYAGLQSGTSCFCGDQPPLDFDKRQEVECSHDCAGDTNMKCGGFLRNAIFKTGEVPLQDMYLGCYLDNSNKKLKGIHTVFEAQMPSTCVDHCKSLNYLYAGLQYKTLCFCGNEIPDAVDLKPEDECDMNCPGDPDSKCGGLWRNSIYVTKATKGTERQPAKPPGHTVVNKKQYEYLGCYEDDPSQRKIRGQHLTDEKLTQQMCVEYCKKYHYAYAGLQSGKSCYCGDQTPLHSDKRSEEDCSHDCLGDTNIKCGGLLRNAIFKTGEVPLHHEYLGCYVDDLDNRKLNGHVEDNKELTPRSCIDSCKTLGYKYAGLQFKTQCYCGNEFPDTHDWVREEECFLKCPGDSDRKCGGALRNSIYKTEPIKEICVISLTTVNGKRVCAEEVVFEDTFDTLSPDKWSHEVQIPLDPDYAFVIYDKDSVNSHIRKGNLVLKPTFLDDNNVTRGSLKLKGCTGNIRTNECGYNANGDTILPPVQSARLTTRNSFNFRYGKVEITAKLPLGDWLVSDLSLEPTYEVYGPRYSSGKFRLATSRGNWDLRSGEENIGCSLLESSILMGVGDNVNALSINRTLENGWYEDYHNYTLLWTPGNITFSVDGQEPSALIPAKGGYLSEIVGFPPEVASIWASASQIGPFDKDFYIVLGLYAGGFRDFPDSSLNEGTAKPWKNNDPKAMLNFWEKRDSWKQTWHNKLSLLQIDYIKVTAL